MNYDTLLLNIAVLLMPCMAIYFFIILCFGSGKRCHSFFILLSCIIGMQIPIATDYSFEEFIKGINISVLIDGLTALSLSMILFLDKLAFKHVILLSFATITHIMVIYDTTIESSYFSLFFYSYYDELIITIGLLQMAVSYDGLRGACVNLYRITQGILDWSRYDNSGVSKGLHIQKERKAKV